MLIANPFGDIMKILRIILLVLLLVVVLVAAGGFMLFNDMTRGPLPAQAGALTSSGLQNEVEILRDEWGIAHIYASSVHDLFYAQGYTHAQDRWWQMEFNRHIGSGTIQELTGKQDDVMGTDMFIRTVGWREAAERDWDALDDETQAVLQAFTDGINAYLDQRPADDLALEYRLLGLTGVNIEIEPWTPVDTLVWSKVMAWNLTGSYDNDLTRAALFETVGADMTVDYAPPFPFDRRPTIVQPDDLPLTGDSLGAESVSAAPSRLMAGNFTQGSSRFFSAPSEDTGIGSNNWVATGGMTESGLPLLANDPHLGIQMPSIWYEIGLHCQPQGEDCPFNVVGFSLPSSPGVVIGHNDRVAWGVTNVGADVQDLYQIAVNPDNPLQYQWDGEWRDMTVREQTISFGDGEPPVTFEVRETHLGPIINDNQIDEETGELLGFNNDDPLALRWTGLEPSTLSRSLVLLNKAQDWTQFREALSYWDIPSQNFVYADVDGNIGYQTPGRIPYRAADHEGIVPVDGSISDYEWRGYVPFDSLPRIYNPEREFIVTANQAVVPPEFYDDLNEALGGDVNSRLSYDWSYGYRGQRINDLMRELAPLNADDYQQIHGDNLNVAALEMMPFIEALTFTDDAQTDARDWLLTWNFRNDMDSPQAALFAIFTARLIENVFSDQLPEDIEAGGHQVWSIYEMLDTPENPWWDDAGTGGSVETRDDILLRSFSEAYQQAVAALGENRDQWRWGSLHTATFVTNPLGLSGIDLIENMVNRGPVETGGGFEIVNATGWSGRVDDYTVRSLPSMRMIVDVSNFDNSQSIHTTGQSGHAFSEHYDNMIELWRSIEYHPMPFSREAVEAAAKNRLVLSP